MKQAPESITFKNCFLKDINPLKLTLITSDTFSDYYQPRIHNSTTIFYVISGKIDFYHEKKYYSIDEGQCFLLPPGSHITLHNIKLLNFKWMSIEFSGDFQNDFITLFTDAVFEAPKNIFDEIINICFKPEQSEKSGYFLSGQLFKLYYELSRAQNDYHYFVKTAKAYIDANYMKNITIEDISKTLNMDRHYISRIFKDEIGLSMKAYLIKIRLERAAELLKNNYTVYQAVQAVGYSDISNFSHKFKQTFGVSPKNYANRKSSAKPAVQKISDTEKASVDYNWSPKDWRN